MPRKQRSAPVQAAILEFIKDYKRNKDNDGNTPTYQEIADALGRDLSHTYKLCARLVARGKLKVNSRGKLIVPRGKWDEEDDDLPSDDDEFFSDQ